MNKIDEIFFKVAEHVMKYSDPLVLTEYYLVGKNVAAASDVLQNHIPDSQNSDNSGVHFYWGVILADEGNYDGAILRYERSIELDDKPSGNAYHNLGVVFFKQEKLDEARKKFDEAIRIDRNSYRSYYMLASIAQKDWQKQMEKRKSYCEEYKKNADRVIELNPGFSYAYSLYGLYLDECEEAFPKAISMYETAIKLDPSNSEACRSLFLVDMLRLIPGSGLPRTIPRAVGRRGP